MRHLLLLTALFCARGIAATPEGDWLGTLDFGVQKLRIVVHLKQTNGVYTATLDSPDQGAAGLPATSAKVEDGSVEISMTALAVKMVASISEDGQTLKGTFTQAGNQVPLLLTRLKAAEAVALAPKRTQIPSKPYPYEEQEVTFDNKQAAGVRLAGTLTVPKGSGPFPAVVLITGSGPQTRDEDVFGHPVFLVLADHLTRAGIAVLRYDDRGIGKSSGKFAGATTADFATDAEAAFDYLKTDKRIDPKRIGLGGHSEGGIVAPMLAARRKDISFLVLIAPSAIPGSDVIMGQKAHMMRLSGVTSVDLSADKAFFDAVRHGKDEAAIREAARAMAKDGSEDVVSARVETLTSPWTRYFISYDPAPALEKITVPTLVLFGEKDAQVLLKDNEPPLRAAFAKSGNKRVRIEVVPGANHLFQMATSGSPTEYAKIEETMSPKVLEMISSWIRTVTR